MSQILALFPISEITIICIKIVLFLLCHTGNHLCYTKDIWHKIMIKVVNSVDLEPVVKNQASMKYYFFLLTNFKIAYIDKDTIIITDSRTRVI